MTWSRSCQEGRPRQHGEAVPPAVTLSSYPHRKWTQKSWHGAGPSELTPLGNKSSLVRERGMHSVSQWEQQHLQESFCSPALTWDLGRLAMACTVSFACTGTATPLTQAQRTTVLTSSRQPQSGSGHPGPDIIALSLIAFSIRWFDALWCSLLPFYFASGFILPIPPSLPWPPPHLSTSSISSYVNIIH